MQKRSADEIKRLIARTPGNQSPKPEIAAAAHQMHEYLHLAAALGAISVLWFEVLKRNVRAPDAPARR